jgi:hypothetical protein
MSVLAEIRAVKTRNAKTSKAVSIVILARTDTSAMILAIVLVRDGNHDENLFF